MNSEGDDPLKAADQRALAKSAEAADLWNQAYSHWQQALSLLSKPSPWDKFSAARAAVYSGRSEAARSLLRDLPADPKIEAASTLLLAAIEERQGRDPEAIGWWLKAIDLHPDPYWARFGLARSMRRIGRFKDAQEHMAQAMISPLAEAGGAGFAASLKFRAADFMGGLALLSRFNFADDERDRIILASLPGMTSLDERRCLYGLARNKLSGAGEIVDLGCWLGSLTVSLAVGIRRNPVRDLGSRKVHAYDRFVWISSYMDDCWPGDLDLPPPADGESFLRAYESVTDPWKDLIETHAGDLAHLKWGGEPIEILSVDAMKSVELSRQIVLEFFPSLLDGASVFHQDFCHHYTWWIHIYHFLLRRHFACVDPIAGSGGVLFEVRCPISVGDVVRVVKADLTDVGLAKEAFAFSLDLVASRDRSQVAAAFVRCEMENGRRDRAEELREQYDLR